MLKVSSRKELKAFTGEPEAPAPQPVQPQESMAGVHSALEILAAQIAKTNEIVAQCMADKRAVKEESRPKEYVATVERDSKFRMKTVIIKVSK